MESEILPSKWELIDTLWNVNEDYLIADGLKVNGINRYIMECKWKSMNGMGQSGRELIDTLWNVNVQF